MNYIYHHGVKGQKWGVRRFQNKDGSLTDLGLRRYRATKQSKTEPDVNKIISTMSEKDRKLLGIYDENYIQGNDGERVVKRILEKYGNEPVGFMDFYYSEGSSKKDLEVSIGVKNDPSIRGKGYGTKLAKKGMNWVKQHDELWDSITWNALSENKKSIRLAEKSGFKKVASGKGPQGDWETWKYKR